MSTLTMHIGRSWTGHPLEDDCPCPKAPCGLVISDGVEECPEHSWWAAKTIRQMHLDFQCPSEIGPAEALDSTDEVRED